ncbi:hypothetical protein VN97_g11888 [Penicillium thymicola]|uniref:Zn(2)-C6 fungal-type domain-containing protein n=1 Tax=Penicillium thymicola TaxID=293382 RepID=A0AAI9T752_PENTH|nr:hypothetical protein VN97_g11888 [Penicillium thymicola]
MNRMPPPKGHHTHAGSHTAYEPSCGSSCLLASDSCRSSANSQTPQPPHPPEDRALPQLTSEGLYDRRNGNGLPLRTLVNFRQDSALSHPNPHQEINGAPHDGSPDYRARTGYLPQDQINSVEHTPISGALPPASHFMTPVAQMASATPPARNVQTFHQNQEFGVRQRKTNRATQACDQCRARKAKCDEGRPNCSHCKENNIDCVYKDVPPHKQERTTQSLLDKLSQLESRMEEHDNCMYERIEKMQMQMLNKLDKQPPQTVQERPASKEGMPRTHIFEPIDPRLDDREEADGELSIPFEHTTAAHKLLMWPSIKRLLQPVEYDEDYVMRLEEERGLISIYGQGENSYPAVDTRSQMDNDFKGDRPDGNDVGPDDDVDIDEFGNLNLDAATARRYYASYIEHMFKLHPFLVEGQLNIKVDSFIRCYCCLNTSPSSGSSYTQLVRDGPPPAKMRRSSESLSVRGHFMETISSPLRLRVGKNVDNALVMLCLALGAICEAPGPFPGPVMDKKLDYFNQPIPAPLPPFNPPPHINGTYVTTDVAKARDEQDNTKNYQAIPGLRIYGYATAILGHHQGGNELEHVQCGLLAGLYAGQLAHPFQSHSWISQASRACQILVRTKRYERLEEGATKDLLNFAYWTCLQLESDLLAELDIPASGISRSECRMPIPNGKWTIVLPNDPNAPQTMMMLFYSAQIYLRKILNRAHTYLYKVEKHGQIRWSSTVQEALSQNLDLWRKSLPKNMQWDESDPPANEINAARMRAKYYGARYIIHRPLLYHALHSGHTGARVGPIGQFLVDSPTSQQLSASMLQSASRAPNTACISSDVGTMPTKVSTDRQPPVVSLHALPNKLKVACELCIQSAIKSTEAFDGVGGNRLIVTNIFGTAHAQFGNMLILSATFMSSLKELVDADQLDRLLTRTICFLIQSENISPTLRADAFILTEFYRKTFARAPRLLTNTTSKSFP